MWIDYVAVDSDRLDFMRVIFVQTNRLGAASRRLAATNIQA